MIEFREVAVAIGGIELLLFRLSNLLDELVHKGKLSTKTLGILIKFWLTNAKL